MYVNKNFKRDAFNEVSRGMGVTAGKIEKPKEAIKSPECL
jgi:hypothetical protein